MEAEVAWTAQDLSVEEGAHALCVRDAGGGNEGGPTEQGCLGAAADRVQCRWFVTSAR